MPRPLRAILALQLFWFVAVAQKIYPIEDIPVSWKTPINHAEVGQFHYLTDDLILLTPFDLDFRFYSDYAPGTSQLIALHTSTGEVAWTYDTEKNYGYDRVVLLSTYPTIRGYFIDLFGQQEIKLFSLQPSDGTVIWSKDFPVKSLKFAFTSNHAYAWYIKKKDLILHQVNLSDGTNQVLKIWEYNKKATIPLFRKAIGENLFHFYRDRLKKLSHTSSWELMYPNNLDISNSETIEFQDGLLLVGREQIIKISSDGQIVQVLSPTDQELIDQKYDYLIEHMEAADMGLPWLVYNNPPGDKGKKGDEKRKLFSELRNILLNRFTYQKVVMSAGYLFTEAIMNETKKDRKVVIFDQETLIPRFEHWVDGPVRSSLYEHDDLLIFTTESSIYQIKISTGGISTTPIPDQLVVSDLLDDELFFRPKEMILSREIGFTVYSFEEQKFSRTISFSCNKPFLASHIDLRNELLNYTSGRIRRFTSTSSNLSTFRVSNDSYKAQIRQIDQSIQSGSSLQSRSSLIQQKQVITSIQQTSQRIDATSSAVTAYSGLTSQISATTKAWSVLGMIRNNDLARQNYTYLHQNRVFQHFYFLPYFHNGWYLLLYDMDTGRSASLELAPHNSLHNINTWVLVSFFFDVERNELILKTQTSDPERNFEFSAYPNKPTAGLSGVTQTEFPFCQVISIPMEELAWAETQVQYLDHFDFEAGMPLVNAVKDRDEDLVEQLLSAGENVNSRDKFGITALQWAVGLDREDIFDLLLEYDADAAILDLKEWSIYNYQEMIRVISATSPMKVSKTVKKAMKD